MPSSLSRFERRQLTLIARVTPYAMAGHVLNTTVAAVAVVGSVPQPELLIWCIYSYSIAIFVLYRHVRNRGRSPRDFHRGVVKASIYALLLAAPWGLIAFRLGMLAQGEELILVAVGVGMAASGTILLSALPPAAFSYMSAILIPSALKCLIFLDQRAYLLLGVLAVSYWGFLAALIAKIAHENGERKRTDEALMESEARYRALYDDNPSMYFRVDASGTVLSVNEFGARQLGYTPAELVGQSVLNVIHEEDQEAVQRHLASCAENPQTVLTIELRKVHRDGRVMWVREAARAVPEPAQQRTVLLIVCEEITERKRAEDRLQNSERKLRDLLGALPAAVYVTDAAGHITYCNRSAVDLWGSEPTLGKDKWSDLAKYHHADGSPMALADCPTEIALKQGRIVRGREAIIERKDGTRIPINPCPTPLRDETGAIVGVVNMTVDISERKKAELALGERTMQLALAGKAALVGSYAYDTDTEIMQISEGYAAIHGFPEGTIEIGRSECLASVHSDDIGRVEQSRSEAFRACRREYSVEYRIIRPDGELRWVETRCFISYGGGRQPHRVVGVSIDITERKRVEEQQRRLLAELDHRVKNVLATIQAVATHTMQASSSMEHFTAALDGRIRSMGSTHELLSHRRWLGIPLAALVERELAPYTTGSNTEIGGAEVKLSAEAAQTMGMVLHELVTNAAKHGALSVPSGRVSIRWRFALNGSASDRLILTWRETGGPLVVPPSKSSYGTQVVRDLIPYELGGTVDHVLAPEGARCRMEISLARLSGGSSLPNGSA